MKNRKFFPIAITAALMVVFLLILAGCQPENTEQENLPANPENDQTAVENAGEGNAVVEEEEEIEPPTPTEAPEPEPTANPFPDPMTVTFGGAQKVVTVEDGGPVASLSFSPDGNQLAAAGFGNILIVGLKTLAHEEVMEGHMGLIMDIDWSPDGSFLASCGEDGFVRLWDMSTYTKVSEFEVEKPTALRWSPDSMHLVVGNAAGDIHILDTAANSLVLSFSSPDESAILRVDWSPDGKLIATAETSNKINLWDAANSELINTLEGYADDLKFANDIAWSPDGKYFSAANENNYVYIWNAADWSFLHAIKAHTVYASCVAWSPDSQILASGGDDYSIQFWNLKTGERLNGIGGAQGCFALAWSPTGKVVVNGSAGLVSTSTKGQIWAQVLGVEIEYDEIDMEPNTDAGYMYFFGRTK